MFKKYNQADIVTKFGVYGDRIAFIQEPMSEIRDLQNAGYRVATVGFDDNSLGYDDDFSDLDVVVVVRNNIPTSKIKSLADALNAVVPRVIVVNYDEFEEIDEFGKAFDEYLAHQNRPAREINEIEVRELCKDKIDLDAAEAAALTMKDALGWALDTSPILEASERGGVDLADDEDKKKFFAAREVVRAERKKLEKHGYRIMALEYFASARFTGHHHPDDYPADIWERSFTLKEWAWRCQDWG